MEQFQKAGMPIATSLSTESPGRPKGKGVRPRWCTYPLRCRCRAYRRCSDRSPCASRHLQTQLLNTAKVMEGSPTALRLKELETLERVAERIDRISVFGGLDQVLNGLVSLKAG